MLPKEYCSSWPNSFLLSDRQTTQVCYGKIFLKLEITFPFNFLNILISPRTLWTEDLEKLSKKIERKSFLVYLVVLFSQRKSDQNFNVQFQLFPVFQEKLHWTFFNGLALKCQQLKSGQKLILDLILGTKKNCKNVLQIIRQNKFC